MFTVACVGIENIHNNAVISAELMNYIVSITIMIIL